MLHVCPSLYSRKASMTQQFSRKRDKKAAGGVGGGGEVVGAGTFDVQSSDSGAVAIFPASRFTLLKEGQGPAR